MVVKVTLNWAERPTLIDQGIGHGRVATLLWRTGVATLASIAAAPPSPHARRYVLAPRLLFDVLLSYKYEPVARGIDPTFRHPTSCSSTRYAQPQPCSSPPSSSPPQPLRHLPSAPTSTFRPRTAASASPAVAASTRALPCSSPPALPARRTSASSGSRSPSTAPRPASSTSSFVMTTVFA